MNALIATSTATRPLGSSSSQVLFKVPSGPFAGRQIVIFQETDASLSYSAAASPYRTWTPAISIATDLATTPFDAVMAPNGDIYVVYSEISAQDLIVRKLTFINGAWSIGSPVVVNSSLQSFDPRIVIDSQGTLWIGYLRYSAPSSTIFIKSSTDGGLSWGGGPTDPGSTLGASGQFVSVKLLATITTLYAVYAIGSGYVALRAMPFATGIWGDEQIAVTGTSVQAVIAAAQAQDGGIGIVYVNAGVFYRRFDGVLFGAPQIIDPTISTRVQLHYRENIPIVTWSAGRGTDQLELLYSHASSGFFTAPAPIDSRSTVAKTLLLFDLSAGTFVDRTTAAMTGGSGDVTHPSSGVTLRDTGDAIYVGMEQPFRAVHTVLSTVGVGGTLGYRYWDGVLWRGFTPAAGTIDLTTSSNHVTLWSDLAQIPGDWQRSTVNGFARFWIRIEVISTFATAPIANQITALSDLVAFSGRG